MQKRNLGIGTIIIQTLFDEVHVIVFSIFQLLLISSIYTYHPPMVGDYTYPLYARAIGWLVAALPLIFIPVCALHVVRKSPGNTWFQVKKINSDFLCLHVVLCYFIKFIYKPLSLANTLFFQRDVRDLLVIDISSAEISGKYCSITEMSLLMRIIQW